MKTKFSLLSLICVVSLVAMVFALFNANRQIEQVKLSLAAIESEKLLLESRLGEQAEEQSGQCSICFFRDSYSSGNELRWRIKAPRNSGYRLMYSEETTVQTDIPKNGRELLVEDSGEFVLAVEFTESHLQMRTYSESGDGSSVGPRRATTIRGTGWLESLGSPKRFIVDMDSKPQYFSLDEPFKILVLPGNPDAKISIWVEARETSIR